MNVEDVKTSDKTMKYMYTGAQSVVWFIDMNEVQPLQICHMLLHVLIFP